MNRKSIILAVSAVLMLAALSPTFASKPPNPVTVTITKGPYLQNVTAESIVIMWETNVASSSTVVYNDGSGDQTVPGTTAAVHEVSLSGLSPDTLYLYRVISGSASSEICAFKTAPSSAQSFRFAMLGDTQRSDTGVLASVINGIIGSSPDILLHTGDIVSYGGSAAEWDYFFDNAYNLLKLKPMFPAIGNHEILNDPSAMNFFKYFSLPNDGTERGYYAFSYGNVQYICLDTEHLSSAQDTWLAGQLAQSTYKWKVVYFHQPPYTDAGRGIPSDYVVANWVPLFRQYGVNIVFSGHTHAYERYYDEVSGTTYIVAGGGNNLFSHWSQLRTLPYGIVKKLGKTDIPHFCTVDAGVDDSGGWLTLNAWNATTGDSFDTVSITAIGSSHSAQASNRYPGDGASDIPLRVTLSWDPGFAAVYHSVYYSCDGGSESEVTTSNINLTLDGLPPNKTCTWRVDEIQADEKVTVGVTWSFTTVQPATQLIVKSVVLSTVSGTQGLVRGRATVTIVDEYASPVSGVAVEGQFTGDFSKESPKTGTTNGSGVVVFTTDSQLRKPSFGFQVNTFSK